MIWPKRENSHISASVQSSEARVASYNPIRAEDLDDALTMLIGPDSAGNLYEIGVVDGTDGPIIVHAMAARPKYLR